MTSRRQVRFNICKCDTGWTFRRNVELHNLFCMCCLTADTTRCLVTFVGYVEQEDILYSELMGLRVYCLVHVDVKLLLRTWRRIRSVLNDYKHWGLFPSSQTLPLTSCDVVFFSHYNLRILYAGDWVAMIVFSLVRASKRCDFTLSLSSSVLVIQEKTWSRSEGKRWSRLGRHPVICGGCRRWQKYRYYRQERKKLLEVRIQLTFSSKSTKSSGSEMYAKCESILLNSISTGQLNSPQSSDPRCLFHLFTCFIFMALYAPTGWNRFCDDGKAVCNE